MRTAAGSLDLLELFAPEGQRVHGLLAICWAQPQADNFRMCGKLQYVDDHQTASTRIELYLVSDPVSREYRGFATKLNDFLRLDESGSSSNRTSIMRVQHTPFYQTAAQKP
jgi:hypothetical protein